MIRIWCAKNQAGHALRRSWMVLAHLALSAPMDLRAISTNDTRWHPVVQPVRLQGPEEKGRCWKLWTWVSSILYISYHVILWFCWCWKSSSSLIYRLNSRVELLRSASRVEMFPCQNSEGLKELHGGSHKNCHQMNDDSFQVKFNQSSKEYQRAFDFRFCSPTQDISGCNLQNMQVQKVKNEHLSFIIMSSHCFFPSNSTTWLQLVFLQPSPPWEQHSPSDRQWAGPTPHFGCKLT